MSASSPFPRQAPPPAGPATVLVCHDLSHLYRAMLERRFPGQRFVYVDAYADVPETLARERPDAVLSFRIIGGGTYPRDVFLSAESVRWIHVGSAGIDHLAPWDAERLMVTNSAGIHARPMAEYATWAVLSHVLRMPLYRRQQEERIWRPFPTRVATEFTALVVGFGRIGAAIGRALTGLGMAVTGVRTAAGDLCEGAVRVVSSDALPAVVGEADFVILTLPRTPSTVGLFGNAMLQRMKPGAVLVNLARGGIVDEAALVRALVDGRLGGAVVDVAEEEPLPPDDPLWSAPGLVVTPHVSADVERWQVLAAETFADNLEAWLAGRPVANVCDPLRGY